MNTKNKCLGKATRAIALGDNIYNFDIDNSQSPSELFEGEHSSLRHTFEEATKNELDSARKTFEKLMTETTGAKFVDVTPNSN